MFRNKSSEPAQAPLKLPLTQSAVYALVKPADRSANDVIVWDEHLPCFGVRLRSGSDCVAFGGWFSKIGARLAPDELVRERFSNKQLAALMDNNSTARGVIIRRAPPNKQPKEQGQWEPTSI